MEHKRRPTMLISGASGGLGSYLVQSFHEECEIFGTYHSRKPNKTIPNVEYYQVDIRDSLSIEKFTNSIKKQLMDIVLINLAGISLDGAGHKLNEDTWDLVLNTNLKGTFLMSRAIIPFMRKQNWGRIINISSIVGQTGIPGTVAYAASKSGMLGLTRTLAAENATKNITVNALALGYFDIGMINVIQPELQNVIREKIPMKRLGNPKNVEQAVRFLVESDYLTGSTLNINGGLR